MSEHENATYLLLKRGLFYRPNDAGYTGLKAEAGRYTLAEGEGLKDCGVTYIHEDDAGEFSPSCWDDIKLAHRTSERDTLRAENERLAEFARWVIAEAVFTGSELCGSIAQDKACELGLIVSTTYDPSKHGPHDAAEAGDEWFVFGAALSEAQP